MFSAKRLQCVVLLMVILSAFTPSFIIEVHAAPDIWSIETLDSGEYNGVLNSLALDVSGYPHISYLNYFDGDLKYARWTGSYWDKTIVDPMGYVLSFSYIEFTSLALDASGYPHIAYMDSHYSNLKYARWTGVEWAIDTIDSVGSVGFSASLALDTSGYPHISYYYEEYYYDDGWYSALKYARWTGSAWTIDTIDSIGQRYKGKYTSLALDASDHPHISYYDGTTDDLKYAWWSGTNWNIDLIDSGGDVF